MTIRSDFPHDIEIVENVWIPMADGTHLAAKLWLPRVEDAVPVLLEYLPYRKDDFTYWRDTIQHGYFAGHGYATARVDIRGTGNSDGVLEDEYLQTEIDDGVAVIAWLARQPWCTGKVGMFGISWGGFNSLQVAAMAPPHLEAVIAVAATADRYATDVHYLGGAVLGSEMLPWASTMFARNAAPPTPSAVDDWREQWRQRLAATPRYIEAWLSHQRRDDYWTHGSVGEDYSAIKCPVYIVGGLADGYGETVLRVAAGLGESAKALLGPWSHNFPELGCPGPNIGFLQEALRWWDQWLLGVDSGVGAEDRVRIWVQDWVTPATSYRHRPGRWITEPSWPPPPQNAGRQRFWLGAEGLADQPGAPALVTIDSAPDHGAYGGRWWGYALEGDLPGDQQLEAAGATSFDSAPVSQSSDVVGYPEVHLEVIPQGANGIVAVQLSDVAPSGQALLVSRGVLNLTRHSGSEHPRPLVAGTPLKVSLQMGVAAHRITPGHHWRLTVSTSYWPLIWPPPGTAPLDLVLGHECHLTLPVRADRPADGRVTAFGEPEHAAADVVWHRPPSRQRTIQKDGQKTTIIDEDNSGMFEVPGRVVAAMGATDTFSIDAADPRSARVTCRRDSDLRWDQASIHIETESQMWASDETWYVNNTIEVLADGEVFYEGSWDFEVPRDLS